MKGFFTLIGGICLLAVTAWFLLTYVLISDKQKVLRVIEKARCSVENGSLLSMSALLSDTYQHEKGVGRDNVLAGLRDLFQQTKDRRIRVLRSSVQVGQDSAEAVVTFLFAGKPLHSNLAYQALLSESLNESKEVHISLIRENRSWKISRTAIRPSRTRSHTLTDASLAFPIPAR